MTDPTSAENIQKLSKVELLVFIVLIIIFSLYSFNIAINLGDHIIPDEPSHFLFSKHFATTYSIPADTPETYSRGWYIAHNPFLYYWISARVINLAKLIQPTINDASLLRILRLLSSLYSIGTLIFLNKLSCLIIPKKGWRLLPVFLLSNTLMFVFLSGGVNYDNLANLFAIAGVYYLIRVFSDYDYLKNSLLSMIFFCLGCLVKFTILPLALSMILAWFLFTIIKRKIVFPIHAWDTKSYILMFILSILVLANLLIYGHNLVVFGSITAHCSDILSESQCILDPYYQRAQEYGPEGPMSLLEAVEQGYPHPVSYLFDFWVRDMIIKIHGIAGHKVYVPAHIIPFYQLFFIGILCLAFWSWKDISFSRGSLLFFIIFYITVLFIKNYRTELSHTFHHFAIQGRYLFPVIGLVYTLVGYTLSQLSSKVLRYATLIATIVLFFAGGPFKFIKLCTTTFSDWFIH